MDGARLGLCPLHFNALYLPKAFTGSEIVRIRSLQVPPQRSTRPIGCLLEIHPGHWRVATGLLASGSAARMVGRWMRAHCQVAASWAGALAFF